MLLLTMNLQKCLSFLLCLLAISSLTYSTQLTGAGASFPALTYATLFKAYEQHTQTSINYLAIGSGSGFSKFMNQELDFGATDIMLSQTYEDKLPQKIVHIPTFIGAVSIVFNLPGIDTLYLSPEVLSDIFLGTITHWSDSKIANINPNTPLPNNRIVPINRSNGSGTTYIFSDFLSATNTLWKESIGRTGKFLLTEGLSAKSNEDVGQLIQQIKGSISYMEYIQAEKLGLSSASIQDGTGVFIKPSSASISKLSKSQEFPHSTKISLVNFPVKGSYPICSFTWLLVYENQAYANRSKAESETLKMFLLWLNNEGQKWVKESGLGVLPASISRLNASHIKYIYFKDSTQ
jgi:phosphate transport system substrate-binding protein